jgi:hypothetical protein
MADSSFQGQKKFEKKGTAPDSFNQLNTVVQELDLSGRGLDIAELIEIINQQ